MIFFVKIKVVPGYFLLDVSMKYRRFRVALNCKCFGMVHIHTCLNLE